jgi:hypothetical protein
MHGPHEPPSPPLLARHRSVPTSADRPPRLPPSAWHDRARASPPPSSAWCRLHRTPTIPSSLLPQYRATAKGCRPPLPFLFPRAPPRRPKSTLHSDELVEPVPGRRNPPFHARLSSQPHRQPPPSESSPLAPCASPRWPPHPFPPPSSCKSAPRPAVTTVRSSPPPDTAASTLPRRSSTVQPPSPRPASAPRHGDALGAHLVACTPPASRHHPRRRTSRSRGDRTLRGRRAPR